MYNEKHLSMKEEAIEDIISHLEDFDGYYCDLHNEVFNTDYYIIGNYQAREALKEYDVFEAIDFVMNYEKVNFGEVTTDISDPERLINMVYYIIGEDVIGEAMEEIPGFYNNWDNTADEYNNSILIKALEKIKNQ